MNHYYRRSEKASKRSEEIVLGYLSHAYLMHTKHNAFDKNTEYFFISLFFRR